MMILSRRVRGLAAALVLLIPAAAAAQTVRIIQTNAAGDNIHIIDPATNTVVSVINGIEVNHGAVASPDGKFLYITNESQSTLDFVDVQSLKVVKQVPLSGHPNNLSISKDGRRIYIAIREKPGAMDIVDAPSGTLAKTIPIPEVHNTFVSADGKTVLAGSIAGMNITIIDAQTEAITGTIAFDRGVRPLTFESNPDGSLKTLYVQLSDYNGFAVVDWATRKEVKRVAIPEIPMAERHLEVLQGSPAHGIAVSPDGKSLWMNSKMNGRVYAYSLPALKVLGEIHVGSHPDWLTFTPDGSKLYVANAGSDSVSVIDTKSMREVTQIKVGQVPKRNYTAILP